MKILLIDQDTTILEMLQTSLSRSGYTVLIAADGNAGLRLARKEQPDLIVLDVMLTGINGFEVCHELKADQTTRHIPIFLITALTIPANNEPWQPTPHAQWQLLHYNAYLPKPLDLNRFLRYVEALLKPGSKPQRPTGPNVLLIIKDDTQRTDIQKALQAHNFYVRSYPGMVKPLAAMRTYPPAALVIDEEFLSPDVWESLKQFRRRNPSFSLIVVQKEASPVPLEYLASIDHIISPADYSWQVIAGIQKTIDYRVVKERMNVLSKQILALNSELVDTNNALLGQNKELDLINRRLHQLSEIQHTLTGMLVHDLKAPLSAMLGAMQFLTMDPNNSISDGSQKILSGGLAAGKQMQRLTDTLLDEQKLEDNQLVFDIEPTDFEEILATCLEMMDPLLNMHRVQLQTQIPPDLPLMLADPIILQRIIENLLDNAIKYTPAKEVISIIATPGKDVVEICVADRGDGIPPAYRETIFDQFTQLENYQHSERKVRSGVGLGLAFCKLAVESMGGKIWVGSLNNIGAAFYFTIPIFSE